MLVSFVRGAGDVWVCIRGGDAVGPGVVNRGRRRFLRPPAFGADMIHMFGVAAAITRLRLVILWRECPIPSDGDVWRIMLFQCHHDNTYPIGDSVTIVFSPNFELDWLNVPILGEGSPYGSIGEFWGQVGQLNASRSHPSNHESNMGNFASGVIVNTLAISGIQDAVYKIQFSESDENLSTCPVSLNN